MPVALIADSDARERIRCVRAIANQTSVSAVGVGSWDELIAACDETEPLSLIIYSPHLPGEPDDPLSRMQVLALRVVIASAEHSGKPFSGPGPVRVPRPIPEETLILLARGAGSHSARHRVSFAPVDFLQMVCMSGDSHVLIVGNGASDFGIIEVREGKVWTAFDSLGVGEDAFARLIRPEMKARVRPAKPSVKERTIHKDLSELLLESLRRIDEGEIVASPPLSTTQLQDLVASPDEIAERVRVLSSEARQLLMNRNYDEAARVLLRLSELDPASAIVRANLEQLRKLGYPR